MIGGLTGSLAGTIYAIYFKYICMDEILMHGLRFELNFVVIIIFYFPLVQFIYLFFSILPIKV